MESAAPWLMLISGLAHAVVNAILKSGRDKMSGRALIDGFSGRSAARQRVGLACSLLAGLAGLALGSRAAPRLAALRETSILFGTAIAVVFLKERLTRSRSIGIVSIALAAVVLIASG